MYEYEGLEGLGISFNIKTLGKAVKNLGTAALKPLTTKISLNPITQVKNLTHSGIAIGKAAEKTVVAINPLDTTLKKFDEKGIEAGGIGKLLGKTGEQARTKPIMTTALFWAGGTALNSLKAAGAAGTAGAGAGAAAGAGAGSTSLLTTIGAWVGANPGTAMTLLSTGAKLAASRGAKPDDINPDTGMPYYTMTDEQAGAQQQADQNSNKLKLIAGGGAVIALIVAGTMLLNPPKHKP